MSFDLRALEQGDFSRGFLETLENLVPVNLSVEEAIHIWRGRNAAGVRTVVAVEGDQVIGDADALAHAVERSCSDKAEVVAADELETAAEGGRALLNLGHTFGHAIETGLGYGEWLHGEAIAAGMVMAADLSRRLGWLTAAETARIEKLIRRARLPARAPGSLSPARFLELMAVDKKVLDGRMRLVLLKAIGQAVITDEYPMAELDATLQAVREAA